MDPLTLGIGAVGLGMQIFGGVSASQDAQKAYGIQQNITGLDTQVNAQRQQQMVLSNSRQQMENFRNVQRARAQGMNAAVNQGAQFGSGISGGQAQATDQGNFNSLGMNQNLQIGENMFSLDNQISQQKLALSGVQSSMATDQSIAGLGSTLTKGAGTISNIFGAGSAAASNISGLFSPGSLSGGFGRT